MATRSQVQSTSVWEGEWPLLKAQVRGAREAIVAGWGTVSEKADIDQHFQQVQQTLTDADAAVTSSSKFVVSSLQQYPQLAPALGISAFSTFVTVKSIRWGLFSAVRNGAVSAVAATVILYPHHVRQGAIDLMQQSPFRF